MSQWWCVQAGLKKDYEEGGHPGVHDWIRQIMAMTALPAFAIPLVWDWWLRNPPATGSVATDCKLQDLADYFSRTWISGNFKPELWSQYDNKGPRTTNAVEGWHSSLNTHFGTPHPSLRVFLHWLQKCQYEVQSRGVQLEAGKHPKPRKRTYVANDADIWQAKVRYGMEIGQIFAYASPDINGVQQSRMHFSAVTETYLHRRSHLLGCC